MNNNTCPKIMNPYQKNPSISKLVTGSSGKTNPRISSMRMVQKPPTSPQVSKAKWLTFMMVTRPLS